MSRNENALLGRSIYDDKNRCIAIGVRELLDEVHGDGIPWLRRNRERLKQSVGTTLQSLVAFTSNTRLNIGVYKVSDSRPGIVASDCFKGSVLTEVTRQDMIMMVK